MDQFDGNEPPFEASLKRKADERPDSDVEKKKKMEEMLEEATQSPNQPGTPEPAEVEEIALPPIAIFPRSRSVSIVTISDSSDLSPVYVVPSPSSFSSLSYSSSQLDFNSASTGNSPREEEEIAGSHLGYSPSVNQEDEQSSPGSPSFASSSQPGSSS